jgi:hypothetical protein
MCIFVPKRNFKARKYTWLEAINSGWINPKNGLLLIGVFWNLKMLKMKLKTHTLGYSTLPPPNNKKL